MSLFFDVPQHFSLLFEKQLNPVYSYESYIMKPETKYQAVLLSYILILVWGCIIFSLSLLDNDKVGLSPYQDFFFELTRYVALALGIIVIFLRLFKVIKLKSNLLLIFTGVLNGFVGVLTFLPLISNHFGDKLFQSNLVNLALGAFIFADVFKKRIKKTISPAVSNPLHTQS